MAKQTKTPIKKVGEKPIVLPALPNEEEIQRLKEVQKKNKLNPYVANKYAIDTEDHEYVMLKAIIASTGINSGYAQRIRWIRYKYLNPNSVAVPGITQKTYNKYKNDQNMIDLLQWYTNAKESGYFSKTFGVEAFSCDDIRQILVFIMDKSKESKNYDMMLKVTKELIDLEGLRITKNEHIFNETLPMAINISAYPKNESERLDEGDDIKKI